MSLLDTAAADLVTILSDAVGGFAVPITIVDPDGNEATINGLATDVGVTIDPETGQAVLGRKASVALPIRAIVEADLDQPRGVADKKSKPWTATFTLPTGVTQTFKITGAAPDKLGCLVCFLDVYVAAGS